jgi:GGDEF domain-containing protein
LQISKNDKILSHSVEVIDTICRNSKDNILAKEYEKLSAQYKKLLNRSNRMIKINDKMSLSVINDNETLKEDKNNIIEFSKKKILNNISSQRKIKENHSEKTLEYIDKIEQLNINIKEYKKDLEKTKLEFKTLNIEFEKVSYDLNNSIENNRALNEKVNILKEFKVPFETILEKEITITRKLEENMVLVMYGIDNFTSVKNELFKLTTEETFILAMIRYLQTNLNKRDIVVHFDAEMFFLIIIDMDIEDIIVNLHKVGQKKVIHGSNISFSGGVTALKKDDDIDTIMQRCFDSYNKAITNNHASFIIKT